MMAAADDDEEIEPERSLWELVAESTLRRLESKDERDGVEDIDSADDEDEEGEDDRG